MYTLPLEWKWLSCALYAHWNMFSAYMRWCAVCYLASSKGGVYIYALIGWEKNRRDGKISEYAPIISFDKYYCQMCCITIVE